MIEFLMIVAAFCGGVFLMCLLLIASGKDPRTKIEDLGGGDDVR